MINLNDIRFRETKLELSPHTQVTGSITLRCDMLVDERYAPPAAGRDRIRREIWNKVYGELDKAVRELQYEAHLAATCVTVQERVTNACAKINALLEPPTE